MIIINGIVKECETCEHYKDGLCTKDNEEVSADMLCGDWNGVEE